MEPYTLELENQPFVEPLIPEGKTIKGFKLINSGKPTLLTTLTLIELNHHSDVANNRMIEEQQSQRPLDMNHAHKLAIYFLKALLDSAIQRLRSQIKPINQSFYEIQEKIGKQNYYTIAPMVANLRNKKNEHIRQFRNNNEVLYHWTVLETGDVLWIIDGQHRRKAIDLVIDFLKYINSNFKYPGKGGLWSDHKEMLSKEEIDVWNECREMCAFCKIAVEVHFGLGIHEEQQLFYDLNYYGKTIDVNLAGKFDSSNPINRYVNESLINLFKKNNFSLLAKEPNWDSKAPGIARKSLDAINAILFLNAKNIKAAVPTDITDFKKEISTQFWSCVLSIPNCVVDSPKSRTVAAQPVVLKAIAKLFFDLFFGKNELLNCAENQTKLLEGLKTFDFSHNNPAWKYYLTPNEERNDTKFSELKDYLPVDDGSNRDMGGYDEVAKTFRFGAKHNDIAPLIGDIIRWHCQLPSRQK